MSLVIVNTTNTGNTEERPNTDQQLLCTDEGVLGLCTDVAIAWRLSQSHVFIATRVTGIT